MVDFKKLMESRNREPRTCLECGQECPTPENDLCVQCQWYRDNPREAPGYWTWTQYNGAWLIRAWWKDSEPMPEPGQQVTAHRRNGAESRETVDEVVDSRVHPNGRRIVRCAVR